MFVPITSIFQRMCMFRMMFRLHRLSVPCVFSCFIVPASISFLSYDISSTIHGGLRWVRWDRSFPYQKGTMTRCCRYEGGAIPRREYERLPSPGIEPGSHG